MKQIYIAAGHSSPMFSELILGISSNNASAGKEQARIIHVFWNKFYRVIKFMNSFPTRKELACSISSDAEIAN